MKRWVSPWSCSLCSLIARCCLIFGVLSGCDSDAASFDFSTRLIPSNVKKPMQIPTLDVLGVGLTVEMFRQSAAFLEMNKVGDKLAIPQDQKYYYWDASYRSLTVGTQREANALEHGISYFVRGWQIPSVSVTGKKWFREKDADFLLNDDLVDDLRQPAGLHAHQTRQLKRIFNDLPESVLESAFQFFEYYPEVPVLLLFVSDGEKFLGDGDHKLTDQTQGIAAILLVRRDRINAIRPYTRPSTGPKAYEPVQPPGLPPFHPSRFIPETWLDWQIKEFDALPTIGIVHRPVTVSYMKDKDGKPTQDVQAKAGLMSDNDKQLAFQAGWKVAMSVLPEGKKQARVFYDHGDPSHGKALVPLSLALHLQDPDFDLFDAKHGYNIHRRLGETGAASPFVMWANGLIATWRHKDASVAVNLRDPNQATITVISPANDMRRHPGGDPIDFGMAPVLSDLPSSATPAPLHK